MVASLPAPRRRARFGLAASLLLAVVCGWILWRFPPELYHFYPVCPIHALLHLQCPGCGTTRALAALLHGRFMEALRLNALAVLLVLPGAFVHGAISAWRALHHAEFRWPRMPGWAVSAGVATAIGFTVLRNL